MYSKKRKKNSCSAAFPKRPLFGFLDAFPGEQHPRTTCFSQSLVSSSISISWDPLSERTRVLVVSNLSYLDVKVHIKSFRPALEVAILSEIITSAVCRIVYCYTVPAQRYNCPFHDLRILGHIPLCAGLVLSQPADSLPKSHLGTL